MLCALITQAGAQSKSQVPLADPFILAEDGTYYAYGTHAADGIEVWVSHDLKEWKYEGLALSKSNTTEKQWFWAPEVYHKNGSYYMYFSANEHLYVAKADTPTGPFVQVGGRQMETLLGDEKCIDSSVFFDDDGTPWLFFVRFTDGNCIWQCRLSDDLVTPVSGTLHKCFAVSQNWEKSLGRVNEGPNLIKHSGRYYLTYSANDYRSQDYGVGYAYASNISKGLWVKYTANPVVQYVEDLVGTGHHTLFYDFDGNLRIVFHAHNSSTEVQSRLMYIGTMKIENRKLMMTDGPVIRPVKVESLGISSPTPDTAQATSRYNINGQCLDAPKRGINIVRRADGMTYKEAVR